MKKTVINNTHYGLVKQIDGKKPFGIPYIYETDSAVLFAIYKVVPAGCELTYNTFETMSYADCNRLADTLSAAKTVYVARAVYFAGAVPTGQVATPTDFIVSEYEKHEKSKSEHISGINITLLDFTKLMIEGKI